MYIKGVAMETKYNGTHWMDTDAVTEADNLTGAVFIQDPDMTEFGIAVLITYVLTFAFGLVGNSLVLVIIGYNRSVRQKSVANYYIWNLSLADLLFILTLPFFFYNTLAKDWPFGDFMCKAAFVFRETNRFSSIFTLVALSFDRFIASFYNLAHLRTIRIGIVTCIMIWITCGMMSSPYWLYAGTSADALDPGRTHCTFEMPGDNNLVPLTFWTFFQLVIGLICPFIIIFVSYMLLAYRLRKLMRPGQASSIKKPSRKTTRTVVAVVLIFIFCNTPYYIMEIWILRLNKCGMSDEHICPTKMEATLFLYGKGIATILMFISSCCNPVLYGLMNDNYRHLYRVVLCHCNCLPVKREIAEAEAPSSESNGRSSTSGITYRFQITFHKPYTRKTDRQKKARSTPTENLMLEERAMVTADEPVNMETHSEDGKGQNGDAGGVHIGQT